MRTYKDFEDYLQEKHAEQYTGLDDEMPDNYEDWLADLDINDLIKWANKYAKVCNIATNKAKDKAKEIIIWLYDLDRDHEISHGRYRSAMDKIAIAIQEARDEALREKD